MSRRSSTNEERFLTLVRDFPKMAPLPIYLSIYLYPCRSIQVASKFERFISERNGSTNGTRLEEGGKKRKKDRESVPYGEKVSRVQLTPGENRYRESRKRVRAVRRKIGEALLPNREERGSPRLIAFSPSARGRDTRRGSRTMGNK